jgi:DNA-binding CsgD family transcriptional regulator
MEIAIKQSKLSFAFSYTSFVYWWYNIRKLRKVKTMIWNHSVEDITKGFCEENEHYICLLCGENFIKGRIYGIDGQLYDSLGAIKQHIVKEHGTAADYLLKQEPSLTGISEIQRQLLKLIAEGRSDKEIAETMEIAQSTVRNHRFKLREKEKQAKLFLAMMQSIEEKTSSTIGMSDRGPIEETHMAATMVDDRYSITDKDRDKILRTYMDENGALKQFPVKEKKKIIVMNEIIKSFNKHTDYSEGEVNRILMRIYEQDYATLRRALIEYGYMERTNDCSIYKVKD